jgi:hypothetical protein
MSRQVLIALVGSVAFVALAFWGVTLMFPSPVDPIIGKWRIAKMRECSDEHYMAVTPETLTFVDNDLSASPIVITAIESDADSRRLRAYIKGGLQEVDFHIPYKIVGDTLTFGPSDWTPEARAKYPSQIAQMDSAPFSPGKVIYKALQIYQPYHRCPG